MNGITICSFTSLKQIGKKQYTLTGIEGSNPPASEIAPESLPASKIEKYAEMVYDKQSLTQIFF